MIIDKDDVTFRAIIESGFVDKTGLIAHLNNKAIGKLRHFIFMSRPHGFGKSVTIEMLNAATTTLLINTFFLIFSILSFLVFS